MSEETWRLSHLRGLDGLRGLAILFVLVAHTQIGALHAAGSIGVTMFFTLSGFLITALLLQDIDDHGHVRLGRFFARRARRLAPALLLFLGAMGVLSLASTSPVMPDGRDFWGALFYVGNYTSAMQARDTTIVHTWSLAVEEQFYLLWPVLLMCLVRFARARWLVPALWALVLAAVVGRVLSWGGGSGILVVTFATHLRMDGLLVGCLVAVYLRRRRTRAIASWVPIAVLIALSALIFVGLTWELLGVVTIVPILTAVVVVAITGGGATWLATKPLELLGKRSYATYLWHYPIFGLASAADAQYGALAWGIALFMTAAIVHLSWRCVEEPFLKKNPDRSAPRLATLREPV